MGKNYYDVLGLNRGATQEEIKKAYRNLSKKYHPDRTGGDDTKFKEINEAYSVLSDPQKKNEFDFSGFGGGFSGGFNGVYTTFASDVRVTCKITLEDAYFGCKHTFKIGGKYFSVDIPKGTPNNKLLKIPGMGQRGYDMNGNITSGDLIVNVQVINTDQMCLGDDGLLEVMYVVDWIDAILGEQASLTLFDREVKFKIPRFTNNGGWVIVGKQGFRKFKSDDLGNLRINFLVKMPKSLTDEQIQLLEKIKESQK